jgi:hypothetical protein
MKKSLLFLSFLIVIQPIILGQKSGNVIYTFGVNDVPNGFNLPLIGLINTAHGNHTSTHIGLINTNTGNLTGAQIGLINTVEDNMDGIQVSLINTTGDSQIGFQCGLLNTTGDNFTGIQVSFINTVGDDAGVFQVGFINTIGDRLKGAQVGFINAVGDNVQGTQIGFINAAEKVEGVQLGFINGAQRLSGLQLGFINKVERVDHGVPVGFLSLVKHGGYKSFEFSFNEMYPFNASYKIGMDKFYTFPLVSYNPNLAEPWAIGFGAGSILPMNEEVYFNPELTSQTVLSGDYQQLTSLSINFGHAFTENMDFLAGPTVVWNNSTVNKPLFSIRDWNIDGSNKIYVGVRAALRYRF